MIKSKFLIALAVVSTFGLTIPSFVTADCTDISSTANCSGIYLGLQGGYSHTNYDLGTFFDKHFSDDEIAGRGYIGVQFNQNFGLESGFTMLTRDKLPKHFGDVKTTHWDLLLKAGLPFGNSGFRGDIKGGGVHIMSKFDANDIANSVGLHDVTRWKIRPIGGASLSYNINSNIAVDLTYFHIFGEPKKKSFNTPTSDLAMIGVSFLIPVR